MCTRIMTVCCVLAISTSAFAANQTILLHPKDVAALKAAGITVVHRALNSDVHAFEITAEVPQGFDSLDAMFEVRNDQGLVTSSAWQSSGGKCVAAIGVGEQALKDAVFTVWPHKGDKFAPNSTRYGLKLLEFAKPPLEPRDDSQQESKSSGFKERFRFGFSIVGPFQIEPIIADVVTVNEPFDIRAKNGAAARGVLRRTAEGGLHFKGEVSHSGRSAVFDAPVELRIVELQKASPGVFLGRLVSVQQRGAGLETFEISFSLSHVEEHVYAGLGLGVSGKQDELIVVPGSTAKNQPPREWFKTQLKADNVLRADQETWVLFRSKQLNRTLMWIERIERDENTFTVTMNGPEATAGDDHYEVHGVNLGKLPTGTYEVKWIIGSGKGGRLPKDSKPAEAVELKSSFKVLET